MNIPNAIACIRNASKANKKKTTITASKNILRFLDVLQTNNFIAGYSLVINCKVSIFLRYTHKGGVILSLKNISKTSYNIYLSHADLWKFDKSLGLIILSTSQGMITHKTALTKCLGGKVLCYIL